jgi:RNA polymerase primary sigma factor
MLRTKKKESLFEQSSEIYFKEISKFKTLSKEEERSLWERYKKNHDLKAREKLITSNLRFVASVAKPYIGMGLSYADLIAEGNLGLLRAIDKFDYTKDVKTISYSVWWIKQTILDALSNRNQMDGEDLPKDYQRLDFEDEDYTGTLSENFIEKEDANLDKNEIKDITMILLDCLTKREKTVVIAYFGLENTDELTLEEIGNKLGITKERVRQVLAKSLKKLRAEVLNKSIKTDIYK